MKHLTFIKQCLIFILLFILFDYIFSLVLLNEIRKPFNLNNNPEILINGSSMSESGFNSLDIGVFTSKQIATYNREGVSVLDREAMINHFFSFYPEGIRTVIYEVNPLLLSGIRTALNVHTHFYPYMDNKSISQYIRENSTFQDYYVHKVIRTSRFESGILLDIFSRIIGVSGNIKTNTLDTANLVTLIADRGTEEVIISSVSREIFERSMETILAHHSDVILVMMPMYYLKMQTFDEKGYASLCNYFSDFSASHGQINFLDLNQDSMIYDARNFSDPLHFNANGQRKLTRIISSYLVD